MWLRDASGRLERSPEIPGKGIVKVPSSPDTRDISVSGEVERSQQALIDEHYSQALSFGRRLHYQPMPGIGEHYHSFLRGWLSGFSDKGKELVAQLDKLSGHQHFPEMLFFGVAEMLTKIIINYSTLG
ncbi:hypothetical protein [Endozoicomonas sp. SCSIO W0465]|uniref:hypothetical protein n=1 Tax=Endozoicomonas sp. SCSIO W0465 TaxID=2918516 RepID=UPI0020760E57|nr:hypothetical protein [Endozoicomonas sp. SCSIO W0465]USE36131.1 hypothetical protein MJO57_29500 [Endozoicomonas sp. SCSIO W0465]